MARLVCGASFLRVVAAFALTSLAFFFFGSLDPLLRAAPIGSLAITDRTPAVSVNRYRKGDRLPVASKPAPTVSSPMVTTLSRPPIGCDPAFSRAADPKRAHIFGRCIS